VHGCVRHTDVHCYASRDVRFNNNNNLQAFQLIVFARYLLGVQCKVCFPTIVCMEVEHCELISRQNFLKADTFVGLKTRNYYMSCCTDACRLEEERYSSLTQTHHTTPPRISVASGYKHTAVHIESKPAWRACRLTWRCAM